MLWVLQQLHCLLMKRTSLFFLLIGLALIVLQGCQRYPDVDLQQFSEVADFEMAEEDYILIVPQNGCSTCVKKSYEFILKNWDSPKIKYVFTHYSSQKAVKIRFKVLKVEDVTPLAFVDTGEALELGISQMYPSLISVGDNGMGSMKFMNAEDGSDWKELYENIAD